MSWTRDEELKLIKLIKSGKPIDDIAKEHDRPTSVVELRLKKIIYENMESGKTAKQVASILNLSDETIIKYFNFYKEFKSKYNLKHNLNHTNKETHNFNHEIKPITNKLCKLEKENKIMKLIIENKELNHKINDLIKLGKLDKNIKEAIKKIV